LVCSLFTEGELLMSNRNDDRRPAQRDEGGKGFKGREQQISGQGKSRGGPQDGHRRHDRDRRSDSNTNPDNMTSGTDKGGEAESKGGRPE